MPIGTDEMQTGHQHLSQLLLRGTAMTRGPRHLTDTVNDVGVVVAVYFCILKVPNSNFGRVTSYPD